MKNLINYLSKKSLSLGNGPEMDRRWIGHESGRFLSILTLFLMLFSFGVGNVWGAKDDVVYKINTASTKIATSTTYANYGPSTCASAQAGSTVSSASWCVTCGSAQTEGLWLGANNNQKAKMKLGNGSFTEASAIATAIGVETTDTYYAAMICRTNLSKVYKVTLTYSTPGGTAPSEAWILYSTDNGSTWSVGKKVTSLSTSGTDFVFDATITSAARYAFVIHSTGYCQFKKPVLTFYEGTTGGTTYTVTYNLNGGTGTTPTESAKTSGETFTLHNGTTNITPPSGKVFSQWKDQDNNYYDGGDTYTMPAKNVTLTAQWATTYTVTYNLNGGTGTTPTEGAHPAGATFTLHDGTTGITAPSQKEFSKWRDQDGTDYNGGVTYMMPAKAVTLTAQWVNAGGDYVLVEDDEDIGPGKYLIVYNNAKALNTHYGSVNTNTYATYTDISSYYSNKKIAANATTNALAYTVAETANGYSISHIESGTTYYLGNSSNSTGSTLRWDNPFTASTDEWTLGVNSIVSARNSSYAIRWNNNSSSYRFAIYNTTGQQAVQLFKQEEACDDPELSYGTAPVTRTFGDAAFTNPLTNSHSVAVTYSSSDETVATVNSEGEVTILKVGSTTITASSIAQTVSTVDYCADEASYTLTVNKANISPTLTYTPNSVAAGSNTSAPTVGGNPGSGGVTYAITSATPAGCATIDAGTGVVSGVAVGSVTVTATVAATTNYNGGSATANVTITAASYFPNGKTIFIQAESSSAWSDANYDCVKAWFHTAGGSETAQTTYWLFDATGGDSGKKLFAAIVPATGDLPYLDIQRFTHDCSSWRNKNGGCSYSDANGSNTIRSTGNTDTYDAQDDYIRWNVSGVTIDLYGDPSDDDWASSLASFSDQGAGVWTATYENYAPANAAGESQDFKAKTNYNGWIGNTGSNNNATLSGMIVGSTYNVTATLNVTDHSLVMSKTFVKGEVSFDLQGHGSAISKLTNVAAGSKISAPSPAPSVTGWDFGGWFKEPACTNEWNFASDEVDETMTLYAKWTKHTYTITSTLNNCSSSPAIPSSYEYTGSAAGLTYTISANDGYRLPTSITVSGTTYTWNSATGALTLTGTITSNVSITITAVQTHKVDWYVGGSAVGNKIGDDGQTTVVDHGGKISNFPATTPDGTPCDKTFVGWTNTTSYVHGTSPLFTDVAGSPQINADANFYAVFATGGSTTVYLTESEISTSFVSGTTTSYGNYTITSASGTWGGKITINKVTISATDVYCVGIRKNADNNSLGSPTFSGNISNITVTGRHNAGSARDIYICSSNATAQPTSGDIGSGSIPAGPGSSVYTDWTDVSITPTGDHTSFYIYANGGLQIKTVAVTYGGYSGYTITCADCGTSVTPTYTAAPTGGTVSVTKSASPVTSGSTVKTCTAVDLTVTLTPATHYDLTGFTATGLTTGTATITPAVGSTLPVSVAQTFTVTVSAGATGTLTLAPTFTAQTPLSITLETHSKGTFTPIGDIYSGESFTFPTVTPSDAECSSFLGWIEGTTWSGDGTETDPTAITGLANYHAAGSSSGTLTTSKTYTAVYGEKDTQVVPAYQKVTSAPSNWSGDYLIVRDDNSRAFDGSLSTLDAADNYIGVTISDGSITANSTVNASKWTIAKVGETSNYTIKSASGYYIGRTANSNGLNSSTSEEYTNTLAYSTDHVDITSSAGPKLQMNGGARFRYYGTSQQVLQLYKYNPDAEVVAYTYCTNPACTPRYRVTMNSATGGSPSADKVYEHADETITLTANPSSGYSFTSWTITKTTGGDNVTSTLLTGDKPTTANTTFTMPAYDITIAATYTKKMVSTLEVKDGATVVSTTTGPVSGTVNISTGANKTLDVVITPSDAYDHSWTATVSAGSTYASITNVTDDGFRVNGLAQGDATITVNAPNDGSAKSVTLTVQVRDIMPEEIILKRDGSNTPIETLIMYYDETNSKGQYVKVNVGYSPANPTNKAFTFSSALTGKVGSHSHAPASGYEVLVANGVTSDAVNCTFTSSADGSVTKVLAVTVLPILSDRFVDYVHGNATQTVSARLSDDRYSIIPDINTPSLSDASDANPTSEDCETSHYHLVGWLPQTTAEALWAAGTPITEATEGLVKAGVQVEATGQTWYAIWGKEE